MLTETIPISGDPLSEELQGSNIERLRALVRQYERLGLPARFALQAACADLKLRTQDDFLRGLAIAA